MPPAVHIHTAFTRQVWRSSVLGPFSSNRPPAMRPIRYPKCRPSPLADSFPLSELVTASMASRSRNLSLSLKISFAAANSSEVEIGLIPKTFTQAARRLANASCSGSADWLACMPSITSPNIPGFNSSEKITARRTHESHSSKLASRPTAALPPPWLKLALIKVRAATSILGRCCLQWRYGSRLNDRAKGRSVRGSIRHTRVLLGISP